MLIGQNKHGRYCVPSASAHRPAAKAILAGEVHEPDTIALIIERARGRGDVVHAGTYFGDILPALCNAGLCVWAFEPNPSNWRHTIATMDLNDLIDVRLSRIALGEADYPAQMVTVETRDGTSYDLGGGSFVAPSGSHDCKVQPLDRLVPGDRHIRVIHLDVEGYEENALTGALQTIERCHPALILETVPEPWVREHLLPLGYHRTGTVHNLTVFEVAP